MILLETSGEKLSAILSCKTLAANSTRRTLAKSSLSVGERNLQSSLVKILGVQVKLQVEDKGLRHTTSFDKSCDFNLFPSSCSTLYVTL